MQLATDRWDTLLAVDFDRCRSCGNGLCRTNTSGLCRRCNGATTGRRFGGRGPLAFRRPPAPLAERLWAKVNRCGGFPQVRPELGQCWLWTGAVAGNGYGHIKSGATVVQAHIVSFRLTGRLIGSGLELDHLCRNTLCVNPDHLEPVTGRVNKLRGTSPAAANAKKTHCPFGHPLDGLRSSGVRYCKSCNQIAAAKHRAAAKGVGLA